MTSPKTWPPSGSEYVLTRVQQDVVSDNMQLGQHNFIRGVMLLRKQEIALAALDILRAVAERYYTTAGFRS